MTAPKIDEAVNEIGTAIMRLHDAFNRHRLQSPAVLEMPDWHAWRDMLSRLSREPSIARAMRLDVRDPVTGLCSDQIELAGIILRSPWRMTREEIAAGVSTERLEK